MLRFWIGLVGCAALALPASAQLESVFKAGTHGAGELKFVSGLPVLSVAGTPTEIGEQLGELIGKNSPNPIPVLNEFLAAVKLKDAFPALKKLSGNLKGNFPEATATEMAVFAKRAEYEPELLYFVNSVYDLSSSMGCATLVVEKDRSSTGAPLFGRNFDWIPSKGLHEQTLLLIVKPVKKHAFLSLTFAPITGVISGMNDAGLCITINEIHLSQSKDKSRFNWKGVPMLMLFRQVLEDCTTVAEAEKLLRNAKRMTTSSLSVCDATGGAVFEITPDTIEVRTATNGVTCCTNQFLSKALDGDSRKCTRLEKLVTAQTQSGKLDVEAIFMRLHEVNQGDKTMQTMVFEPKERKLHLKLSTGKATASQEKATTIDVAALFGNGK